MTTLTTVLSVKKCKSCHFCDGALDYLCTFKRNFKDAPRRNQRMLSDVESVDPDTEDRIVAIYVPEKTYEAGRKPTWCRLKEIVLVEKV